MTTHCFHPLTAGSISLANRIVMAPLTRNRAPNAVPTPLMATYYQQRASAGLLITEATAITPPGLRATPTCPGCTHPSRSPAGRP